MTLIMNMIMDTSIMNRLLKPVFDRTFSNIGTIPKIFDCSEYRRRHMAFYGSHDIFRADNAQGSAIRRQSAREAVQDAILWLKEGNGVAIFDGTNITREQRRELNDYCLNEMGFRILFIECVCEDQDLLERNIIEILHYSADYKSMSEEEAVDDLRKKLEHYMRQYEPIDSGLENISFVRVENLGETVTAHKVIGQKEAGILGYLSGMRSMPQTIYFTRHGESEYNVLGRIGGDASLSARGQMYAHALADFMNNKTDHEGLTVWTSELRRTKQTAAEIRATKRAVRALNELDAKMPYIRKWDNTTCPQIWSEWESNGRNYVIQDLEPKDYELANDYFIEQFILDEKLTSTLDLNKDPVSVRGMRHFWDVQFAKNVSLGCYCEINGVKELIAWNCCNVECADDIYEEDEKIEGWATKNVINGLHYVGSKVDVFKKYNVDKYLGGSGLFVRREFRGEYLGSRLLNAREPLCRYLGIKLTSTIFTGIPSQKCAARCGFETIAEVTLGELGRNGMGYEEDDESVLKLMTLYYG